MLIYEGVWGGHLNGLIARGLRFPVPYNHPPKRPRAAVHRQKHTQIAKIALFHQQKVRELKVRELKYMEIIFIF